MNNAATIESIDTAAVNGWGPGNEREIPIDALGLVTARIAKVNRKAEKLGVPAFVIVASEPYLVDRTTEGGHKIKVEMVRITVTGAPVQITGYRFLGRIDFEDGINLVNARPGEIIPPRYRTTTTLCDHCASLRQRKSVFIFRRDGGDQHIQVGRTCLKDFMGHDPARVLHSASLWDDLSEGIDADANSGTGYPALGVDEILAMAAAVVRVKGGFISKAAAAHSDYMVSTAAAVYAQLFPPKVRPGDWVKITPEERDAQRAAQAKAWALESMSGNGREQSDYEYNLTTLLQAEAVNAKRMALLVSLVGVYARHLGEIVKKAARVETFVGEPGQRRKFVAIFQGESWFPTSYGEVYIGRFETPEGLLVYKGATPFWGYAREGDSIEFTATIKKHDTYNSTKQTLIQRVKVAEAVAA